MSFSRNTYLEVDLGKIKNNVKVIVTRNIRFVNQDGEKAFKKAENSAK